MAKMRGEKFLAEFSIIQICDRSRQFVFDGSSDVADRTVSQMGLATNACLVKGLFLPSKTTAIFECRKEKIIGAPEIIDNLEFFAGKFEFDLPNYVMRLAKKDAIK